LVQEHARVIQQSGHARPTPLLTPKHRALDRSSATSPIMHSFQSHVARNLRIIGGILALLTLLAAGLTIWDTYRRTIEDAKSDMRDLGLVLAEQATRYVQVIDQLLREVQLRSHDLGIRTPEEFRLRLAGEDTHLFLAERLKNLPQAHATGLFGADGVMVNTSRATPIPGFSVADRDYFVHLRDHAGGGVFVSSPAKDRGTGPLSIFIARRISAADGTFLGAVVSSVDVDYLIIFYQLINQGRHVAVTLLRRDGTLLARYPAMAVHNQSMPIDSMWHTQVAAGGGAYLSSGYFSGDKAIVSANPLRDYPLVVDVSIHEEDVLATWRRQAASMAAGAIMLAGLFFALFSIVGRQIDRQEANQHLLRDFAELASDWFWEQDKDLRFTDVGLGSPLASFSNNRNIGKRRWEINDTSRAPERWEAHRHDMLNHRRFVDFRFDRIGADGLNHHVSISGVPVHDRSGVFAGYRGIGRDVTAEVTAAEELREAKSRAERAETTLHDAVDSMSEGFVIYDPDDKFVMCNEAYRHIYQQRADLLVPGVDFKDILHDVLADGCDDTSRGREADWLMDRLRFHQDANGVLEQHVATGSWILATDRRMKNGGTAGLRIDITALKHTQDALRESEARLDRAQMTAGIGSWELDVATGRYIWSKEMYRIRGVSPEDFEPNIDNVAAQMQPDDYASVRSWIADLIAGVELSAWDVRIVRPDGEPRVLRLEGRAVTDPDGGIRHLAGTMQDVTERRLIDRQLVQSQKMEAIGNLTGGMAHDFNNGLAVIIGNLDLLGRLVKSDPTATELCGEARDGALRCGDLIRLLLAFARQQPLSARRIDVNELAARTVRLLSRTLGEDINLTLHVDKDLWPVVADPAQLEAALTNLANNARDAMPRGGRLEISTERAELDTDYAALHPGTIPGSYVLIKVTDSGTGIPPGIISKIFEPFFTTKEQGHGTGLGLSMVFGFTKQSGGHLTVYSEPGLGSTFRIYLPRASCDDEDPAAGVDTTSVVGGNETVLVVDDNAPLRRAVARQLRQLGYLVREAEHAAAALAILASGDPLDLLFTDIVMPGTMNGLDLANEAARQRPALKVLLTSGFPDVRGVDHHMTDCPFHLLTKPYLFGALARALRAALDGDAGLVGRVADTAEQVKTTA
jgi:PAS domain S-box-containing protein